VFGVVWLFPLGGNVVIVKHGSVNATQTLIGAILQNKMNLFVGGSVHEGHDGWEVAIVFQ
jgi:hypothetical protein